MANCVWTYVSTNSKQFRVELYHGETSGHVLMTVNGKVSVVDFKIFESKTYTLFLDHELCRVVLDRQANQMYYRFEVDQHTDTPLNRARRHRDRQHLRKTAVFFLVALGGVVALAYFLVQLRQNPSPERIESMLNEPRMEAIAKIVVDDEEITYSFVTRRGKVIHGKVTPSAAKQFQNTLQTGDEFVVEFNPKNPNINRIDPERPKN